MTIPTMVLAPYGPALWQDALPRRCHHILPLPPVEHCLSRMVGRVLEDAPPAFAVIGFCLGGVLALEIARQARERVRGLALINTMAATDTPTAARIRAERIAKLEWKAANHIFPDDGYLDHAVPWLLGSTGRRRPMAVAQTRSLLAEVPLTTSLAQQRAIAARLDGRELLTTLDVPTLFLGGGEDRVCRPEHTKEMGLLAVNGRAIVFEDCGHVLPIEDPVRTRHHLTAWLQEIGARRNAGYGIAC